MLQVLTRENISTFLGYSSIGAWIGAQAPQLVKNWQLGSVEGLALPFLVSWFFGDLTNLIGCILTHQLPFQTYLATYFVFVDVGLLSQYLYYSHIHPIPVIPPLTQSGRQIRQSRSENWSGHRNRSRKRRSKSGGRPRSALVDGEYVEDPMTQSWMSESSANSPASALASSSHRSSRQFSLPPNSTTEPPSPATSYNPERGRTLTRPSTSTRQSFFGPPLETISGSPASTSPAPGLHDHLPVGIGAPPDHELVGTRRNTSSTSRSRPPATRRSTSMMFLSVGLLVTFGSWGSSREGGIMSNNDVSLGKAWGVESHDAFPSVPSRHFFDNAHHPALHISTLSPPSSTSIFPSSSLSRRSRTFPLEVSESPLSSPEPPTFEPEDPPEHNHDDDDYPYPKRNLERFLGRASAWICTTLYLTSRLPQIWQNFRRRSVEGLSMLLFVMAFVGNSLYVLSILTHPSLSQPGYLLESTPYLMGSGGTLCFDITIVFQSYLYSEERKERKERDRRRSVGKYAAVDSEEAAALLSHDFDFEQEGGGGGGGDRERRSGKGRSRSRSLGGGTIGRSRSSRRPLSLHRTDSTQLATKVSASSSILDDPYSSDATSSSGTSPIIARSLSRGTRTREHTLEDPPISPIVEESLSGIEGLSSVTIRP